MAAPHAGVSSMVQQLPNLISILRLLLVPWFALVLLEQRFDAALGLFLLMGVSDGLDGYLARRLGAASPLGAALDPLADKVMLVSAFVLLGHLELLPAWLVVLAVGRDVLIIGGALLLYLFRPGGMVRTAPVGKINTFLQIVLVLTVLVQSLLPLPLLQLAQAALVAGTAVTAVASGLWYAVIWSGLSARLRALRR